MDPHRTVLICDDDQFFRTITSRVLEADGWSVLASVGTAVEALRLAAVLRPQLVVMDMSLPGMSGLEAIPELDAMGCEVIVCTGFGSEAASATHAGARAVVDKSDVSRLPEILASLLALPA